MGAWIIKQPNGLFMRFSSVTDCPTHYNMTKEWYINSRLEDLRRDLEQLLEEDAKPHSFARDSFMETGNMTKYEFDGIMHLIFKENPSELNVET